MRPYMWNLKKSLQNLSMAIVEMLTAFTGTYWIVLVAFINQDLQQSQCYDYIASLKNPEIRTSEVGFIPTLTPASVGM